jgi:hypothetical protein
MAEPQKQKVEEKILKDINLCFSIQDIGVIKEGIIDYHKYKIKIKDKDGKEIEPTDINLDYYLTDDAINEIRKLFKIYGLTSNEKLIEGAREEILKRIAVLILHLY